METERVVTKAPHPRYAKGLRDTAFRREHARFVKEQDKAYIDRHNLAERVDEAWEKCMLLKPSKPLTYLSNALAPLAERGIVMQLQDEIADLKAADTENPDLGSRVVYVNEEETEQVTSSLTSLLLEPAAAELLYSEVAAQSAAVSEALRSFDSACTDHCQTFLGTLRLFTDNLQQPSLAEGFLHDLARRHVNHGIIQRDYHDICAALIRVLRAHLLRHAREKDNLVKSAWVKLHLLVSNAMSAGSQGRDLHAKHRTSLSLSLDEISRVHASLLKIRDRDSAAAAIARGVADLSPAVSDLLQSRGMPAASMGRKLLDGIELVIDMLQNRGHAPALTYLHYLGGKHAYYGVSDTMYPIVGQSLLSATTHSLRKDSDRVVEGVLRSWRKALGSLVEILSRPGCGRGDLPSAATMGVSAAAEEVDPVVPHLESDMAEVVGGRATPDPCGPDQSIDKMVGDVSGVPVTDSHLKRLFDTYDKPACGWLSKDTMVGIILSQECFGVPLSESTVRRQVDEIVTGARTSDGMDRITFHLFSIIMLRLAQR